MKENPLLPSVRVCNILRIIIQYNYNEPNLKPVKRQGSFYQKELVIFY
jgi:hypothetical protein